MRRQKIKGLIAYDSEAYIRADGEHELAYGVFSWFTKKGKLRTKTIQKSEQFFEFVNKHPNYLFVIHNAKYDLSLLHLSKYKEYIDSIYLDMPIYINFRNGAILIDSMNFFKNSLDELKKAFLTPQELEQYNIPYTYKEEVRYDNAQNNYAEWNTYINKHGAELAKNDSITLLLVMEKFYSLIKRGKEKYRRVISLAQLSYQEVGYSLKEFLEQNGLPIEIFRKLFVKEERDPNLNRQEAQESYRGGRNEALRITITSVNLNFYDVNSLYPTVMLYFKYPYKFYKEDQKGFFDLWKMYDNDLVGLHKVKWKCVDIDVLPIVTFFEFRDSTVLTQVREGEAWLTSPELDILSEQCEVEVKYNIWYKAFPIFVKFVNKYYELKQKAPKNSPQYLLYKILLNSGYGKWGQHKERRQLVSDELAKILDKINLDKTRFKYENKFFTRIDEGFYTVREELNERIAIAIASMVTGYARTYLYRLIQLFSYNVFYVDTDSIATNASPPSYINFKILGVQFNQQFLGEELGSLKLEKKGPYMILGKKMYYKTEQEGDWLPLGFKRLNDTEAEGIRDKHFVVKGVDKNSKVKIIWNPDPFKIKFISKINKVYANWKEVRNIDQEKLVEVKPRLKYEKADNYYQGYPL
ncbi:MAG: DNA polymerase [Thermoplasmata archaeon]